MTKILFPVGRMVGGSLYKAKTRTDNLGKPKMSADGVTPMIGFDFAVAIKKTAAHWFQEQYTHPQHGVIAWGDMIKKVAEATFGAQSTHPSFAWKVVDGDSTIPNKNNKRPVDQEGYPGHWVIWFSQGWCPALCNADGSRELTEPDSIVPGYFVQVLANVVDNGKTSQSPGVYMNPEAVALAAYGEKIIIASVDTASIGFGGALPAGASATPVGAMSLSATPTPAATPSAPPAPNALPKPPTPNAQFLQPPPKMLTPAGVAAGGTYDDFVKAGWNDQQMKDAGYLA
jgi:hypothetical protein